MLVTNVGTVSGQITTVRGYGGTAPANLADDQVLHILGNAALKGDDAPAACFTSRARKGSWTQVFTAAVRVCRSDLADRKLVLSELDFQKTERLRELLRDLESTVVNGISPRPRASPRIIPFITSSRGFGAADEIFRDLASVYESDFGVCRVILCRSVPADTVLLLDSTWIDVLPLAGRSFHYKPLAAAGDYADGKITGEDTLELRNENAHD